MCKCNPKIRTPYCGNIGCTREGGEAKVYPVQRLETLSDCIVFATRAHEGQKDKIGEPYIFHPFRVMSLLCDEASRMAAVLHDVVEDTPWTLEDLRGLGLRRDVLEAVDLLTKRPGVQYEEYLGKIVKSDIALRVKIADLRDNMSPARLYKLPHETRERLTRKYIDALHFLEGYIRNVSLDLNEALVG